MCGLPTTSLTFFSLVFLRRFIMRPFAVQRAVVLAASAPDANKPFATGACHRVKTPCVLVHKSFHFVRSVRDLIAAQQSGIKATQSVVNVACFDLATPSSPISFLFCPILRSRHSSALWQQGVKRCVSCPRSSRARWLDHGRRGAACARRSACPHPSSAALRPAIFLCL